MVECCVTLDRADNKDNVDNVRLITFPCHNDECQTLEELEPHKNSHQQCVYREQIEKWSSMLNCSSSLLFIDMTSKTGREFSKFEFSIKSNLRALSFS